MLLSSSRNYLSEEGIHVPFRALVFFRGASGLEEREDKEELSVS
jgi:hypothetical protein